MISDLNGSLGARYFLNVTNERTCFTSCPCAFKLRSGFSGCQIVAGLRDVSGLALSPSKLKKS